MNRLRRALVGLSAFALITACLLGPGAPVAHAAAPDSATWWYKPYTSGLPVRPSPPVVPAGGLYVQQDATSLLPPVTLPPVVPPGVVTIPNVSGPTAFATLRLTTPRGSPAILTLKMATASTAINADIVACSTLAPWEAPGTPGPGAYDKAPSYSCAHPVKAMTTASQMSWQLPVSMQFLSGTYDIALVPDPGSKSVFAVAFDPPGSSSVVVNGPGGLAAGAAGASGELAPLSSSDLQNAAAPGLTGVGVPLSSPGVAPPAVAAPPAPGGGTLSLLPSPGGRLRPVSHGTSEQRQRELAVGLLLGLVAAWWYVGGQSARSPRLLGALAGRGAGADLPVSGGIGRFVRPRSGPARRLR